MKKIYFILLLLVFSLVQVTAQTDAIKTTIATFPYQHTNEADAALTAMQSWDKASWKSFLSIFDGNDSTQVLKATYALNAYLHHVANDAAKKKQAATFLSSGLGTVKSFNGRYAIILDLALLGEDVAVKPLATLLADNIYAGNAARALAFIHSPASIEALNKALVKSKDPARKHIQAALDNVNSVLPEIKAVQPAKKIIQNDVQQLLSLQDQMDAAKNSWQKKRILAETAHIPGFNSLMFVSHSLNDPAVGEDAASIIARLALADKTIRGRAVREALEKALPLIKGEDSALLVKNLSAHIALMPYDNGFVSLFNGKDLTGWKALVGNPVTRAKMKAAEL